MEKKIHVAYGTVTPSSLRRADYADIGWVDVEGINVHNIDQAVAFLRDEGVRYVTTTQSWFATEFQTVDNGTVMEKVYELEGFTAAELKTIQKQLGVISYKPWRSY